ncbi:guanine-1-methyltransferase-domain-containing protein [Rostrohypoxylon terebratum]|nr:guanine-1-methyltransferase-domain-containing protein [Rostrohypoxylon terebratum]
MAEPVAAAGDLPPTPEALVNSTVAVKSEVQSPQNSDQAKEVLGSKRSPPANDSGENANDEANCKRHKLDNGTEPNSTVTMSAPSPSPIINYPSSPAVVPTTVGTTTPEPTLSKNQQRKLRKQKLWAEKKKDLKFIKNQKRKDKQDQKRIQREAEIAAAAAEGREPVFNQPKQPKPPQVQAPITVILDCQFEKYMMEKEIVSLANQVTRCYSDNRNSRYPVHLFISSYGGKMKERNETILQNQFKSWKNVHFVEDDFVGAASKAKELMSTSGNDQTIETLAQVKEGDAVSLGVSDPVVKKKQKNAYVPQLEAKDVDKTIVYLTADSPYTIDRLEPGVSYVIGGIIDKNREKGLCYKIAQEKNVRTAKLPIGDFMVMQSRHVLATNHVLEIMLQWLETGDWGKAFMKVIPTRKGGKLKEDENKSEAGQIDADAASPEDQSTKDAMETEDVKMTSPKADEPESATAQDSQHSARAEGERVDDISKQAQKASPGQETSCMNVDGTDNEQVSWESALAALPRTEAALSKVPAWQQAVAKALGTWRKPPTLAKQK